MIWLASVAKVMSVRHDRKCRERLSESRNGCVARTADGRLLRTGGFCCGAKFYCPRALAGGNQCIRFKEKTLEFSSVVLSILSPYLKSLKYFKI